MTRPPVTLRVLHTCNGADHVAMLTLKPVKLNSGGFRYDGVRCDGTEIQVYDVEVEQPCPARRGAQHCTLPTLHGGRHQWSSPTGQ